MKTKKKETGRFRGSLVDNETGSFGSRRTTRRRRRYCEKWRPTDVDANRFSQMLLPTWAFLSFNSLPGLSAGKLKNTSSCDRTVSSPPLHPIRSKIFVFTASASWTRALISTFLGIARNDETLLSQSGNQLAEYRENH